MNIDEALDQPLTDESNTGTTRYFIEVAYVSSGDFHVGFPKVMRALVNDEHEFVFDVPEQLGRHTGRFEITGAMKQGVRNTIRIVVSVYDVEIVLGKIKSVADIKLRAGRATLFAESYASALFWRRSEEVLSVLP